MKIKYSKDKLLSILFIVSFLLTSLMDFLTGIDLDNVFSNTILIISKTRLFLLIIGLFFAYKNIGNKLWLGFSTIFLLLFFICKNLYPINNLYLIQTFRSFIPILIMVLIILTIKDMKCFIKCLFNLSVFMFFITFVTILYLIFSGQGWIIGHGATYMSYSYGILPCACCFLFFSINKKNKYFLKFCFIVSFISIFLWGCRGALISIILYAIVKKIHYYIGRKKTSWMFLPIAIIIILGGNLLYNSSELINVFETFGIHSRMLKKISTNNDSTGRTKLYKKIIESFDISPFEVRGINADYTLLGGYAHNIFLEIFYDFGGILGTVMNYGIILLVILTIMLYRASNENEIILYFFSISFFRLLVSHSLFINFAFWCWFILILRKIVRSIKRNVEKEAICKR